MTVAEARHYLHTRLQDVYDRLGAKSAPAWNGRDAEAVRTLLRELGSTFSEEVTPATIDAHDRTY